jgi:hypothetical protein
MEKLFSRFFTSVQFLNPKYLALLLILLPLILFPTLTKASNPLDVPNNKFGMHIISSSPDEIKDTASLVNTNGDWGYITFLIESSQRDKSRWQTFFNELRRSHLIPIVRIATKPEGNTWAKPYEKEEEAWASFLDELNWPTKNRYIVIYNEPNHATEWGGSVDPVSYAQVLDKTITALKKQNPDFFVINGGLDASAPNKTPSYMDSFTFMDQMNTAVPGIFNKLDGWSSHSYPNPNFAGQPTASGKMTIRGYQEEIKKLQSLGVIKELPIFITETGWKHAEGKKYNSSFPSSEKVGEYYQNAFQNAWNNSQIVAVTPFILDYQDSPFDNFSFKKILSEINKAPDPSSESAKFYPAFYTLKNLPKNEGKPIQINSAKLQKGGLTTASFTSEIDATQSGITTTLVANQNYDLFLTVENTGQSIWNDDSQVSLVPFSQGSLLGVSPVKLPVDQKIEPGQSYTFRFQIKAPTAGTYKIQLNMYSGEKLFDSEAFEFVIDIKSPVALQTHANLRWKKNPSGSYLLTVLSTVQNTVNRSVNKLIIGSDGTAAPFEAKYLLPNQEYDFILERPFYKPVTIHQKVTEGVNILDFGELQPDISSAFLSPSELWKLLPWSE